MSEQVTIGLVLDDIDFSVRLDNARAELDKVMKKEKEVRTSINRTVRESFQILNYVYRSYRVMLEATGQEVDEVLDAFMNVLNGAISIAIITQMLSTAETMLGNVLAIFAGFLAGVALGRSLRALQEVMTLRGETAIISQTAQQALNEAATAGRFTQISGGTPF